MAYCHFEVCCDWGLGCFSESLLADIRRLSVVAMVFLYQITVFFPTKHNSITFGTFLMTQCKPCTRAAAPAVAVNKERSPMGRCSIYRHRTLTSLLCHWSASLLYFVNLCGLPTPILMTSTSTRSTPRNAYADVPAMMKYSILIHFHRSHNVIYRCKTQLQT